MKKKLLSLLLCAVMLVGLLPVGAISVFADEYDYTDPDNPYIATDLDGLREVFNKERTDGETRYIRLGKDIIKTIPKKEALNIPTLSVLTTNGAPVVFDLAGYKLGVTVEGYRALIGGKDGAEVTIEDSKRYDSSKNEWVEGRVEYRYDYGVYEDSFILNGNIVVKGGQFKNNTHVNSAFDSEKYQDAVYYGKDLEMFGGSFEADFPIVFQGKFRSINCVIHNGTLRVNRDVAISTNNFDTISSDSYPVIERCEIVNASGNDRVAAFDLDLGEEFAESHTAADAFAVWNKIVSPDVYAYIDDEIQQKGSHGVIYNGLGGLVGPLFSSNYVLAPVDFIDGIMIHAANFKAGEELSYYAGTPSGTAYSVDSSYTTGKYWKNGVSWKNIAYNSHTLLEVGNTYTVSFRIKLNEKYIYHFANEEDITASVNGNAARAVLDGDVCIVHYTFTAEPNPIDRISVFVTEPKAGDSPVYSATVPSGADYKVDINNAVEGFKNGVSWMDGITEMPAGAKFTSGHSYNVLVIVNSADYQLSRFVDAGSIKATVNGRTANVIPYSANRYGIYYTFNLSPEVIDTLDVAVPEPKDGELITSEARIPSGHGYSIENRSDGVAWESGVKWTYRGMTLNPQDENRFEAGETYTVSVSLTLTDETVFSFANQMDMVAYVNDKWADFDRISDSRFIVSYTFTVPYDPSAVTEINYVSVSVAAPMADYAPIYAADVPAGLGYKADVAYNSPANGFYHGVRWARGGETISPSAVLNGSVQFIAGEKYTVTVSLVPTDGTLYKFAGTGDLKAAMNGKTAVANVSSDGGNAAVSYTFTATDDLCSVYWYLNATSSEPTAGVDVPRGEVFGEPPVTGRIDEDFVGWYKDRGLTLPYDPSAPVTEDIELFARWERKPNPFTDVPEGKWYTGAVIWCYYAEYMTGTSATTFAPGSPFTRAMFVTVLAKIDGADTSGYTGSSFSDVPEGKWFSKPIQWAYTEGYASGLGGGKFGPNNAVTREQLAQFLYNYSQKNGYDVSESADLEVYPDAGKVSGWALNAVKWAIGCGLISGVKKGDDVFISPKGIATRAQVALIIKNYILSI